MKRLGSGKWLAVSLILALVVVVGACSAAEPSRKTSGEGATSAPGQAPAPAAAPQAPRAANDSAMNAGITAGSQTSSQSSGQSNASIPFDRMIIRTVTLSLIVKDVEGSIAAARDLVNAVGGFVAQSSSRYDGEHQVATMTLQVPAAQFDATVDALRRLSVKVENENGTTQDVTEEYTDLQSQVRNLQATEAALQRLMDRATRMEDILALQRELTAVRGEIEKRQGRLNFLSRRTEMSTISLSFRPEVLANAKPPKPRWQPLETAREAWEASMQMLMAVIDVLIAILVFIWWLVPLALIAAIIIRNRRAQHRGEQAA